MDSKRTNGSTRDPTTNGHLVVEPGTGSVAVLEPSSTTNALALAEALDVRPTLDSASTTSRLHVAPNDDDDDDDDDDEGKPLWYLAYGSNLNSSVFRGRRGIRPLAARAVLAPGLQLVFDLPGLPYFEPRFANARVVPAPRLTPTGVAATAAAMKAGAGKTRHALGGAATDPAAGDDAETSSGLEHGCSGLSGLDTDAKTNADGEEKELEEIACRLRDGPWTGDERALVGVAYLVTPRDFARVLASEGGGASYQMVAVDARVLKPAPAPVDGENTGVKEGTLIDMTMDLNGATNAFTDAKLFGDAESEVFTGEVVRTFTLVAPRSKTRTGYGEASLRYLTLIRDGAKEHALPTPYLAYLLRLHAFHVRTWRQRVGGLLLAVVWAPLLLVALGVGALIPSPEGQAPRWLTRAREATFKGLWASYDRVWRDAFGEGERDVWEDKGEVFVGNEKEVYIQW